MKILLTVPSLDPRFGGPLVKVHALSASLNARGHMVRIVGCGPDSDGVIGLRATGRFHGTPIPSEVAPLRRAVDGADVVHIVGFRDPVGTIASRHAQRRGIPYVVEPVGMHRRRIRSLALKRAFDRAVGQGRVAGAAMTIATSELEMGELIEDGVDPVTIRVRPNGVSVEDLLPLPERGAFRERHGIPDGAKLVLSLGRITRKKGLPALASAAADLADTWVAIVGPDDGDGTLERLRAMRGGLEGRLIIEPSGSWGSERAQIFADADAFALPSATENFGIAPAEAAAVGVPVVVSDRCGVVEFLDARATTTVPFGDTAALREALRIATSERSRLAGNESAERVRSTLSWDVIGEQQERLYLEAVQPHVPRPHVVLTVPSLDRAFGGPAVQLEPLATALRGEAVTVTAIGCGDAGGSSAIGLPIRARFHGTPIPSRIGPLLRAVDRADVVHVLGYRDPVGSVAAMRALRKRIPLILEPMGMHRPRIRSQRVKTTFDLWIGDRITAGAAQLVATSEMEAAELRDDGVDPGRIVVRPNGVDVDELIPLPERGAFRERIGIPDRVPLVLFLGRITRKKGLASLVQAIAKLDAWLAVVGPDSDDGGMTDVLGAIQRAGIEERVKIDSRGVWGAARGSAFADADVFCLPSATENFGNAAAEAASLGLPVVLSDRCGVAPFLPPGSTRIVPYGDTGALADALNWALDDAVRAIARDRAHDVRASLDWGALARDQAASYRHLISSSPRRR